MINLEINKLNDVNYEAGGEGFGRCNCVILESNKLWGQSGQCSEGHGSGDEAIGQIRRSH